MRLAELVVDARVEQDALGRRGLAGIDVRHDADVADLAQVREHVLCHRSVLIFGAVVLRSAVPRRVAEDEPS